MDILTRLKQLINVSFAGEHVVTLTTGAATVDFANGQKQIVTLDADATLTMAAPPGAGHYQLQILQNGTGGWTLAFSGLGTDPWIGSAIQPEHNTAANGRSVWNGYFDGSAWVICSLAKVGAA